MKKTKYIPIRPANEFEEQDILYDDTVDERIIMVDDGGASKRGGGGGGDADTRPEEKIGVLAVRAIRTEAVIQGGNEKQSYQIYIKLEVENEDRTTGKKKNIDEQTWLENYYFIVRNPDTAKVRLTVMRRVGVGSKMLSSEKSDKKLGTVTYLVKNVVAAGGKVDVACGSPEGTFSDKATNTSGLVGYSLEYAQNKVK